MTIVCCILFYLIVIITRTVALDRGAMNISYTPKAILEIYLKDYYLRICINIS